MNDIELNRLLAEAMGYETFTGRCYSTMDCFPCEKGNLVLIKDENDYVAFDYKDPAIVLENIEWLGDHSMYPKKKNDMWYIRRYSEHWDCTVCQDPSFPKAVALARIKAKEDVK